jgi:hypothetical protein
LRYFGKLSVNSAQHECGGEGRKMRVLRASGIGDIGVKISRFQKKS